MDESCEIGEEYLSGFVGVRVSLGEEGFIFLVGDGLGMGTGSWVRWADSVRAYECGGLVLASLEALPAPSADRIGARGYFASR